jgi:hypothetical protein
MSFSAIFEEACTVVEETFGIRIFSYSRAMSVRKLRQLSIGPTSLTPLTCLKLFPGSFDLHISGYSITILSRRLLSITSPRDGCSIRTTCEVPQDDAWVTSAADPPNQQLYAATRPQ